ncbi:MAG: radical SAM protein [Candidatus Verstraetearchaeota archaeon]|nr:radical SAM protein [Candidatus Verstraetearchaeota archaeon]
MSGYQTAECRSVISRSKLPGLDYTFNPYVGCGHGCVYCYVPDLLKGTFSRWPADVKVKEGVLEKLRKEVQKLSPGVVGISTSTDPYQPIEADLKIVRGSLEIFRDAGFPVSIQTKSPLVTRDMDLLGTMDAEVGITITSSTEEFRRRFEPSAPTPQSRFLALERLSGEGIRTWIFYGPIIHGFNDTEDEVRRIVGIAASTGSRVLYDKLNLKPLLMCRLLKSISREELERASSFDYRKAYAMVAKLCREAGVRASPAF